VTAGSGYFEFKVAHDCPNEFVGKVADGGKFRKTLDIYQQRESRCFSLADRFSSLTKSQYVTMWVWTREV
jgi:hypothetical protein